MLGKNNKKVKSEKQAHRYYRYTIKKLTIGVTSVAIGAGLAFLGGSSVSAQEADNTSLNLLEAQYSLADLYGDDTLDSGQAPEEEHDPDSLTEKLPESEDGEESNLPKNSKVADPTAEKESLLGRESDEDYLGSHLTEKNYLADDEEDETDPVEGQPDSYPSQITEESEEDYSDEVNEKEIDEEESFEESFFFFKRNDTDSVSLEDKQEDESDQDSGKSLADHEDKIIANEREAEDTDQKDFDRSAKELEDLKAALDQQAESESDDLTDSLWSSIKAGVENEEVRSPLKNLGIDDKVKKSDDLSQFDLSQLTEDDMENILDFYSGLDQLGFDINEDQLRSLTNTVLIKQFIQNQVIRDYKSIESDELGKIIPANALTTHRNGLDEVPVGDPNAYISNMVDATNAKYTLSGSVHIVDQGQPSTFANGLTPAPDGTKVYLRWFDRDGAVSPLYVTETQSVIDVNGDGRRGGDFAFDLRQGWVDANGDLRQYRARAGQYYTLYVPITINDNGNRLVMLRQASGYLPRVYANSVTGINMGQFPLIGTNMQKVAVFMSELPEENKDGSSYMTVPVSEWTVDPIGPMTAPAGLTIFHDGTDNVDLYDEVALSGHVWLETGAGDWANSATGPNNNTRDPKADGYYVGVSWLTPEGRQAYDSLVRSRPISQQADATKVLLTARPDYIGGTRIAKTDLQGRYTIRFNQGEGIQNGLIGAMNYVYFFVLNPDFEPMATYSAYTIPVFRSPLANMSWRPQPMASNAAYNSKHNINFAVIPTVDLKLRVTSHDTDNSPAKLGDTVTVDVTGDRLPPKELNPRIRWTNEGGDILKETPLTPINVSVDDIWLVPETAEEAKDMNIKSGEIIQVKLVTGYGGDDSVISTDSFIVQYKDEEPVNDAADNAPFYPETSVERGEEKIIASPFNRYWTPLPEDIVYSHPDDEDQVPWSTVNSDGSIRVYPSILVKTGDYYIPVQVNYPDGSKETIYASVTVEEKTIPEANRFKPEVKPLLSELGEPIAPDDILDQVSVPGYAFHPNFPSQSPSITLDRGQDLPDGTQLGYYPVDVTISYPDKSSQAVIVPVNVVDTTAPTIGNIDDQIIKEGDPIIPIRPEVDDPSSTVKVLGLPDGVDYNENLGLISGTPIVSDWGSHEPLRNYEIILLATDSSDNTGSEVFNITIKRLISDLFDPEVDEVDKPYGQGPDEDDITGAITIPGYPEDGSQPNINYDPSDLPDGSESGKYDVPVTIDYPDGSQAQVTVPVVINPSLSEQVTVTYPDTDVTVGQAASSWPSLWAQDEAGDWQAVTDPVVASYVLGKSMPNGIRVAQDTGRVSLSDSYTGDRQVGDQVLVPVLVNYADGSTEVVGASFTVNAVEMTPIEPITGIEPIEAVTVINGQAIRPIEITPEEDDSIIGDPAGYPDGLDSQKDSDGQVTLVGTPIITDWETGETEREFDVTVPVVSGNGAQMTDSFVIVVQRDQASLYDPHVQPVEKDYGQNPSDEDIQGAITIPGQSDGSQPDINYDPSDLPDGSESGKYDVPVTIDYPDGSQDTVEIIVEIEEPQSSDDYDQDSSFDSIDEGLEDDQGNGNKEATDDSTSYNKTADNQSRSEPTVNRSIKEDHSQVVSETDLKAKEDSSEDEEGKLPDTATNSWMLAMTSLGSLLTGAMAKLADKFRRK